MVTYLFIISIGYLIENSNFSEKMYLGNWMNEFQNTEKEIKAQERKRMQKQQEAGVWIVDCCQQDTDSIIVCFVDVALM